jgi:hypothetical protein
MRRGPSSYPQREPNSVCDLKVKQDVKIQEIGAALVASGIAGLDNQASALGLSRSTTWTILKGNHKASGLSATVVNRILAAPKLPALVRAKVLEYVADKAAGRYGHGDVLRRKFVNSLSVRRVAGLHLEDATTGRLKPKVDAA